MSVEQINKSATITAQNTFTDAIPMLAGEVASISAIYSTAVATTVLQRQLPGQSTWQDVPNPDGSVGWTASTQQSYRADERCDLRLGVKTGGYTSGTITARLGKG